jgi:hypothetical protein
VCVGVMVVWISYPAASPKWAGARLSRLFSGVSAAFLMFRLEIKSRGENKIEKLLTDPVRPSRSSHFEAAEIGHPWLRLLMFWSSRFLWCSRLPRQLSSYRMDFNCIWRGAAGTAEGRASGTYAPHPARGSTSGACGISHLQPLHMVRAPIQRPGSSNCAKSSGICVNSRRQQPDDDGTNWSQPASNSIACRSIHGCQDLFSGWSWQTSPIATPLSSRRPGNESPCFAVPPRPPTPDRAVKGFRLDYRWLARQRI